MLAREEAAHLARRTCFSANKVLVDSLSAFDSYEAGVKWLLEQTPDIIDYPKWYVTPIPNEDLSKEERKALRRNMTKELFTWYKNQLLNSQTPFTEMMVLFWHNHFVSAISKVKSPSLMLKQNTMFRRNACGNYKSLLNDILHDPAMLIYLDNANNKKESPNENLARELLELFTLGEGNYTEFDIKELARALTGASVARKTGEYKFRSAWHDKTDKTIFSQTGNFSVEDVAELILSHQQSAEFITKKLWSYFIDENYDDDLISEFSQSFRDSQFDLSVLIASLLNTQAFKNSSGKQIKSPVNLMVGTFRYFDIQNLDTRRWLHFSKNMGQHLFNPPNVKGWPGGMAWYSSANIFYRELFVEKFLRWYREQLFIPEITELVASPLVGEEPEQDNENYLFYVMADPAYQVC